MALINPFPEAICCSIGPNTDSSNRVKLLFHTKTHAYLKSPVIKQGRNSRYGSLQINTFFFTKYDSEYLERHPALFYLYYFHEYPM